MRVHNFCYFFFVFSDFSIATSSIWALALFLVSENINCGIVTIFLLRFRAHRALQLGRSFGCWSFITRTDRSLMIFLHAVANLNAIVRCQVHVRVALARVDDVAFATLIRSHCSLRIAHYAVHSNHSLFRPVVHYSVDRKWKWRESETIARARRPIQHKQIINDFGSCVWQRTALASKEIYIFCVIYRDNTSLRLLSKFISRMLFLFPKHFISSM